MKIQPAVFLLGVGALLFPGMVRADFNLSAVVNGQVANSPGGAHGTWGARKGQAKLTGKSVDQVQAISLAYNVDQPKQVAGAWFGLSHFDIRSYDSVEFKARGAKGGEMLAFGFKDDRWFEQKLPLSSYLKGGVTTQWQTVKIPIKDFTRLKQPYSMDNWSLSFANTMEGAKVGEVYVADVKLVGSGAKLPLPVEDKERYPIPFDPATATDDQIYDLLQRAAFEFFWKEANPENGLVKDACFAFGDDGMTGSSIASVGFGLSAICVAEKRGWITHEQAYGRVLKTLKFFRDEAEQYKGFYYHFYEMDTGYRSGDCELSSIDSGLLFYGILTVKEFYKGTEVEEIARTILDRVEWNWMQINGGFLSMGWKPEEPNALIPHNWGGYNEGIMLYPLAIGSKTHPINPKAWDAVDRREVEYNKRRHVAGTGANALFTHQYPQVWLDLRNRKDRKGINYFTNSVQATWANYEWCMQEKGNYKTFKEGYWGLTACDGPDGYVVDGAPFSNSDGTVAPTAALGSFAFTPKLSMDAVRSFFKMKDRLWGKYGFVDGFNLDRDWTSGRYIGIDQGPIVLMIENLRTGLIWDLTMRDKSIQDGLDKMGFVEDKSAAKKVETPSAKP